MEVTIRGPAFSGQPRIMTDTTEVHSYPGQAELIGGMQPLLKAARRPLAPEWERLGLDRDGWHQLHLLAHRLLQRVPISHPWG